MDLQRTLNTKTLLHIKNLQKLIDAHRTKASSLKTRKQWLDMQKRSNYSNEYERIRGLIDHNLVRGKSITGLRSRIKDINDEMKKLGAKPFEIV